MQHRAVLTSTSVQSAHELLSDAQFLAAFAQEVGVLTGEISVVTESDAVEITMPWQFRTDIPGIPSMATRFLPMDVHLNWWQRWLTDEPTGDVRVDMIGTPKATCTGSATLRQAGDDVEYLLETETKAGLPWPVRGTVESMINKELVGWIVSVQERVANRRD